MNLNEFKTQLAVHAGRHLTIHLPQGGLVPPHFHVTEVGHVAKKFVDCGGTFRTSETCVLQTWTGRERDDGHRLTAGKLAHILGLAQPILPASDLPVEVEYEDGVVSQFPIAAVVPEAEGLAIYLGMKHTACLAREKCGADDKGGCDDTEAEVTCCGGEKSSCCGA